MTYTTCNTCGQRFWWRWQEAFDKFGYDDGDGQVETQTVVDVLEAAGYRCEIYRWGLHNSIIVSIKGRDGEEMIPPDVNVGYDDPNDYLPSEIIGLLTRALPDNEEVVA